MLLSSSCEYILDFDECLLNLLFSCVAAAKHGPDPTAAVNNGILPKAWANAATMAPVKTFIDTPPAEYQPTDSNLFAAQFNGINSMVCKSYTSIHTLKAHITDAFDQTHTPGLSCLLLSCQKCDAPMTSGKDYLWRRLSSQLYTSFLELL